MNQQLIKYHKNTKYYFKKHSETIVAKSDIGMVQ